MYDDRIARIKVLDPYTKDVCGRYVFQTLIQDIITLKFYVVSTVNIPHIKAEPNEKTGYFPIEGSHMETLIFESDYKGNITDWVETAGGGYMDQEEAINMLADRLRPQPCPTCGQNIPRKES